MLGERGDGSRRKVLIDVRKTLGLTQADMAEAIGLSLRQYGDIENERAECRLIHMMAAERLSLLHARQKGDANLLAWGIRYDLRRMQEDGTLVL